MEAVFFGIIVAVLTIPVFAVILLWMILRGFWRRTRPGQSIRRFGIVALGCAIIAVPYVTIKISEHDAVLSRVPQPLEVASIEYRLEQSWGLPFLAMPGDNETGFVVYRLTPASAQWAKDQGSGLGEVLSDGNDKWQPTPIDDAVEPGRWHPYEDDTRTMSGQRSQPPDPTIKGFLDRYGFSIPIEEGHDVEANRAIQSEGSFYSYGSGGSVTIVDPSRGKVYFAYAG